MARSARILGAAAAALFSLGLLSPQGVGRAEAACRAVPDGAGGAQVRCGDGKHGRLVPDGSGGYTGQVGGKPYRVEGNTARQIRKDNARAAFGGGASGGGGTRDNTRASQNCMAGGLRVTNC